MACAVAGPARRCTGMLGARCGPGERGGFGGYEGSGLEFEVERLAGQEEADGLIGRLPDLPLPDRLEAPRAFERRRGDVYDLRRFRARLADIDASTAGSLPVLALPAEN